MNASLASEALSYPLNKNSDANRIAGTGKLALVTRHPEERHKRVHARLRRAMASLEG